ncbi:M14 family metallopeptidase [Pyxidicoccus fallax]|uniref:M14 family metallopeptidase n=1 Tax=Pyxidicoccus fallax TaxID=394095 RepID=A0A848L6R3_9BACT|nr:M14 family metallopeptidase [Pyxidicoccus fallax]NMO14286.1 M14 family metallopeptidase [Pyxidicoccus fallax]NPC79909.1 M14 family metallopeptidase [Pyxidicoccus fallax]
MTELLTRAEASKYTQTSRHSDVLAFVDELCRRTKLVRRVDFGKSGEGQPLMALIVSDRNCFTPELARKQKKAIVLIEANIHAGEVEGKESVLALARDLTLTKLGKNILDRLCLVLVPNFNPDGNDRISPNNRKLNLKELEGQVNPEGGVGTRYTGEGWNLNRDNTKQEAPETRALAALYQTWWPHVFIDCHTTDGSIHGFDLTYDTSHSNEPLFSELRAYNREMLERVAEAVKKRHDFDSFWYGNYKQEGDPNSGWHTYPALPRFGSHYRGLLGRMDVLLETYSYIDFPRRCAVMRAWLLELIRDAAKNAKAYRAITEAEEARIIERGESPDVQTLVGINYGVATRDDKGALAFEYPAYAKPGDTARILAYDEASIAERRYPGKKKRVYKIPHYRTFVPTQAVSTPAAYLVPAELASRLEGHGIRFERLPDTRSFTVDSYRVARREETFSPDVAANVPPPGEAEVPLSQKPKPVRFETVLTVAPERTTREFPAGTLYVPTAQRAGTLAVYLLEPHSDDGFCRWQFLDNMIAAGELYPVHRVVESAAAPKKAE